jgi:hypothetical protein
MNHGSLPDAPIRLHTTFSEAVEQLRRNLDPADFDIIRGSQGIRDVLKAVDDALKQTNLADSPARFAQFPKAMASIVRWLDKNSAAIDVVMQSGPQICGLGVMGLIWGGLKFLIIVRPSSCCAAIPTRSPFSRHQKISQTRSR